MKVKVDSNIKDVVDTLKEKLSEYQSQIETTVFRALTLLEAEIVQNIRSGSGLKVRTGNLLNSIGASKRVTTEANGAVTGSIGPEGVVYAAIHEFGGVTSPHRIEPRSRNSLKFFGDKGETFAKFVNHPGSRIPARPYLRPAVLAKEDEILKEFGLMIKTAFKE